jgi:XTP/dITP diphosphohydrolase
MNARKHSLLLVIATRNRHKADEIQAILGGKTACRTLNDFPDAPKVIEDAPTFAGNATKKAVELAHWLSSTQDLNRSTENFVLADDSGLEVDALNGQPGVHSARFAALDIARSENSPDSENNARLLRLLKDLPPEKRTARFRCVIALTPILSPQKEVSSPVCSADAFEIQTRLFEGSCEGRIDLSPRGQGGFGYDPLFVPEGFEQSFAELGEDVKNRLSHRARALEELKSVLFT